MSKIKKGYFYSTCAAFTVAAAALVTPAAAQAQNVDSGASEADAIIVTGTRIQNPGTVSASPITAIGAQEIQQQGAVSIENVLNRMPMVTPDANENVSNGADGTAKINLRNLGSNRNLILVNGQRLLPVQATDVNFIPSSLVERIDVVTGGASAVYGSDAVSGVVNFILKDNLEGVHMDAQYGFSMHRNNNSARRSLLDDYGYEKADKSPIDGEKFDANIAMGTNFADNRGNVTAYFGYRKVKPIVQADRDVSACALDPNADRTGYVCGGSSNNEYGLFQPLTGPSAGLRLNNTKDGQKTWVPYGSDFTYNYAPLNYFQRSDERFTAGAFAHYEVTPAAEIYGSFMFMDDHTYSQVAPSALWQGETYTINCNNPLMSASQGQQLCGSAYGTAATQDLFIGYRPVAGDARPRRDSLRHTDYRVSGGVKGEIADGITYDTNVLYSRVLFQENYQNDIDPAKAKNGLLVVDVNGVPTCQSVVDGSDPKCVPLDVFGYNNISADAFNYIYAPTFTRGVDTETVLSGNISADLTNYGIVSPWASQGIGAVFGVEHRRETLLFEADALAIAKGTNNSEGKFNVTEFYTEVQVPIIQDMPMADELTITGGYRLSDYSNLAKKVSTYKAALVYAPIPDLRLRASYNRAIRAPNISELYAAQSVGNVSGQDPCSGSSPTASLEQCVATGLDPAQYGSVFECPANTCSALGGGNPDLKPETADTYTVGLVLQPRAIPRLTLTADYFNIKVKDYISSVSAELIINQCTETGDPYFCSLFHRDPRSGVLFGAEGYVQSTTQNTGSLKTSGIDLGATYRIPTDMGQIDLNFDGTWLNDLVTEPLPGLGSYDCKGLFGPTCGQPSPEWRHQARITFSDLNDLYSISVNWRYIGGTKLSSNSDQTLLVGSDKYIINSKLPAYNYFDLTGSAKITDALSMRIGVNNLFDKDPPAIAQGLLSSFGNGNTYPGVYDVAGRSVFVALSADF
ncbi:TonB-dependent receptor [Altererythrobacter indicus]|uniref:TonB-dependent receptor n=1 Tax=Altericroceibacterium indicum TaxID=374177 RepID=A0A845ABR8_9SPHN|nr:TonB-dependent receptor [Altericroceibacterium indicum]MXP27134.1 TonB-dependent receptor [Altericroceibacterium indicum]